MGRLLPCLGHFVFVVFGCCLLGACSFLKQDRAAMNSGQVRGWGKGLGGVDGGDTGVVMY